MPVMAATFMGQPACLSSRDNYWGSAKAGLSPWAQELSCLLLRLVNNDQMDSAGCTTLTRDCQLLGEGPAGASLYLTFYSGSEF